ncbi:MAG: glycosyltransferase family 2 protein [Microbacterium sp.]|uniref:glycosyltransferase n=1 Tax=Microbacterium sp. TaxID=51671 RepID=UPI0027158870|nr:glycosyltransferase family 2 protein [Microbacterium sp.]MDO8383856.1 glycosyltransferase family 2 protein [Microbacterium sp.]
MIEPTTARDERRPTVSIVIPARNKQAYLADCLDAIAMQTDPPDQVIVVDNASSDATAIIARAYPFVTLLSEPTPGIVPARDTGLNAATSDVLCRIDADSIIDPDWVRTVRTHFAKAGFGRVHGVSGPGEAIIEGHPLAGRLLGLAVLELIYYPISALMAGGPVMVGCNMAISRAAWLAIRDHTHPDHRQVHEDLDLSVLIHQACGDIEHLSAMRIRTRRVQLETPSKLWWRIRIWPNAMLRHRKTITLRRPHPLRAVTTRSYPR